MKMSLTTPDGFSLSAIYNTAGGKKAVILAHGMTVDKDDEGIFVRAEQQLNTLGFSTIRFDFRSHGESTGESTKDFTISGELKDVDTVAKYLKQQGYEWIGLAGASFGGGISALYAGMNPEKIHALFLANPVLDYKKCFLEPTTAWAKKHFANAVERIKQDGDIKIGSRQFGVGLQLFEEMSQYFPYQELAKYTRPLFIAHGTQDSKVSYEDTLEIYEHLPNSNKHFETIVDSEHGFHEEPFETQVTKMLVDFLLILC